MFVSHAQNHEDVVLWRALSDVKDGFYVDIGAAWPDKDSVTRAFYERGWQGVNVEPNPALHAALVEARGRDRNVACLISAGRGTLPFFVVRDTGLSTTDALLAREHQARGFLTQLLELPCMPLSDLLAEHVPAGQAVHFLKIDVEGAEAQVIASHDWRNGIRPWVIVVESTTPLSSVPTHQGWEPLLLAANYSFCLDDGLNRYYLANEHADRHARLSRPANSLDEYVPALLVDREEELRRQHNDLLSAAATIHDLRGLLEKTQQHRDDTVALAKARATHIETIEAKLQRQHEELLQLQRQLKRARMLGPFSYLLPDR